MRIIHTNIGVISKRGGPPVVIANLAAEQARMGHDVCVVSLASDKDGVDEVRRTLDSVSGGAAVRMHVLQMHQRATWLLGIVDKSLLPEGLWDVVHIHELWSPFDYAVSRAAIARQIPYVITMHGLLSPNRLALSLTRISFKALKKRVARALWVDRMLRGAHFVQGLTEFECLAVAKILPGLRLVRIANGYGALSESEGTKVDEIRGLVGGRRFVLFMGRLHILKGTDLLVTAFAAVSSQFPNVDLVIAGSDFGQRSSMEAEVAQSAIKSRVHFIGMTGGGAKSWLLKHADVFVLPSREEGFSIAILEAMSMASPVIMTHECHFPEAEAAGAAIVIDVTSTALANALEKMLSDTGLRERVGQAGQTLVRKEYAWRNIAKQVLAAYESE